MKEEEMLGINGSVFLSSFQMERIVALFVSGREGFLVERACINCPVDRFCACDRADELFDIDGVMRQRLVDVGEGIKMSEPVKVEGKPVPKSGLSASLSHQGILAICDAGRKVVFFTDLNTNKRAKIRIEDFSLVSFYDEKVLLLTMGRPLRETRVVRAFNGSSVSRLKRIEGTDNVRPFTDVSLLNETRVLYYSRADFSLWAFDVDTRANEEICAGRRINTIASLTGIDCGVRVVFHGYDDGCAYALGMDNTIRGVRGRQEDFLRTIFPSSSSPRKMGGAAFRYNSYYVKGGRKINTGKPRSLSYNLSIIRVYRDIFLTFDRNSKSWVLVRLVVP